MSDETGLMSRGLQGSVRDVLLMVLSILIAFGLDAWWDGTRLRQDEATTLVGLRAELEANRNMLVSAAQAHSGVLASTKVLLEATGPTAKFHSALQDELNVLLGTHTFDPLTGTLDGLLNSGQLGLIQDDVLRTMLASWPSWLADYMEDEDEAKRQVEEHIAPFMGERIPLRDTAVEVGLIDGIAGSEFVGQPDELLQSLEFESLLVSRAVLIQIVLEEQATLSERLTRLLDRLDMIIDQ